MHPPHYCTPNQVSGTPPYIAATDLSVEESAHLNKTLRFVLSGRLILQVSSFAYSGPSSDSLNTDSGAFIQGRVCWSLLLLDVKEMHLDDFVSGGSFVKDFAL